MANAEALRLLMPVPDAARALGIGRTKIYELITAGRLETVHIGRRTLVKVASVRALAEAGCDAPAA